MAEKTTDEAVRSVLEAHEPLVPRPNVRGTVNGFRRRWKAIVGVIVAAIAIGAPAYVLNYQPLVNGHTFRYPVGPDCIDHVTASAPRSGERFEQISIECPTATTFAWGDSIGNDGPLPITITAIEPPLQDHVHIEASDVRLGQRGLSGDSIRNLLSDWEQAPEIEPFSLRPGETQGVLFRVTLGSCDGTNGIGVSGARVHYSVLGVSRVEFVPLRASLDIRC